MAADVVLTDEAKKNIREINNPVITARLWKLVKRLKNWPDVSGVKALKGDLAGCYRLRTGDYRLQFRVETWRVKVEERSDGNKNLRTTEKEVQKHRVIVEKAGHRDGFYKA